MTKNTPANPSPPRVYAALVALQKALREEYGLDHSYVVLGRGRTLMASNQSMGDRPPVEACDPSLTLMPRRGSTVRFLVSYLSAFRADDMQHLLTCPKVGDLGTVVGPHRNLDLMAQGWFYVAWHTADGVETRVSVQAHMVAVASEPVGDNALQPTTPKPPRKPRNQART